jgi:capsid portal protein
MGILVDRCYSETTPESAEQGENSDNGFICVDCEITFRKLVDYLNNEFTTASDYPVSLSSWFSTGYYVDDYSTMTEREETLHFSRSNPHYKIKYWHKAIKAVYGKGIGA